MIYGRWKEDDSDWKFFVKQEDILESNLQVGKEVIVFDGYWGERVEITIDTKISIGKIQCYTTKDRNA